VKTNLTKQKEQYLNWVSRVIVHIPPAIENSSLFQVINLIFPEFLTNLPKQSANFFQ